MSKVDMMLVVSERRVTLFKLRVLQYIDEAMSVGVSDGDDSVGKLTEDELIEALAGIIQRRMEGRVAEAIKAKHARKPA